MTVVLALGIIVLVVGIALGERAGDRVIGQVTEKRLESIAPVTVTPAPAKNSANPYGPDWKRTDVMAAASDPGFPDPRVPPVLPPTPTPVPKYTLPPATPAPTATPTPNMNLPIWRRAAPLPTATPVSSGSPGPVPSGSPSAAPTASPEPF
ncbi:MAG TPA: hypothetical protein VFH72_01125 [Candidatus Baltobacteraceae bacterium]|jgi:hypothetical protein|nr:hypothetical protein [Candidatus Baltobacteraceae bacterium]